NGSAAAPPKEGFQRLRSPPEQYPEHRCGPAIPREFHQTRILAVFDPFREVKMTLSSGASFVRANVPCERIETGAARPPPGGQIVRNFQGFLTLARLCSFDALIDVTDAGWQIAFRRVGDCHGDFKS
ncbi:MAG: hypothetical protein ABIP48_12650, partial [Planctomycetota bacterium]